jgi:putative CocE/NonD family hydrolase
MHSKLHTSLRTLLGFSGILIPVACLAQSSGRYSWPKAKFEVRREDGIMVPMRDGVHLATDLYFPSGDDNRWPVILIRTPYNKVPYRDHKSVAYQFAGQGYIVAVQDTRGRYASEGDYTAFAGDVTDGYDTTDWLSKQAWSSGSIGTYGCSYVGDVQILQAQLRHPNLKAMIPQAAGSSIGAAEDRYYYFGARKAGNMDLASGLAWFSNQGNKDRTKPAPHVPDSTLRQFWGTLPLVGMVSRAGGARSDWDDMVSRELTDSWWDQFGYLKGNEKFDVPALHIGSWYDFGVAEVLLEFNLLRTNAVSTRAKANQFIVISPTNHCQSETGTTEHTVVGGRDVGDARFEYYATYLKWFDHWLNGIDNSVEKMSKVQIYVMGKNTWRGENEWPLARTQFTKYYLHSDGHANSRSGLGTLNTTLPEREQADQYTYDPGDAVQSRGGPICCTGNPEADGSYDQSEIEKRSDVLVYSTQVLKQGIEVTGPLKAVLYVSSSAKDTDFTAKLVDVYPDGTAYNVQEGILRARYREGFTKKVWMKAGEVYEIPIDLEATSNYFGPGHRIRLEVSSSNFPRFDRNLNTGGNNFDETTWVKARNTVHHTGKNASYILLPVIPEQ